MADVVVLLFHKFFRHIEPLLLQTLSWTSRSKSSAVTQPCRKLMHPLVGLCEAQGGKDRCKALLINQFAIVVHLKCSTDWSAETSMAIARSA